jgi:hypothetical protein
MRGGKEKICCRFVGVGPEMKEPINTYVSTPQALESMIHLPSAEIAALVCHSCQRWNDRYLY